jgi:hypothetical protein
MNRLFLAAALASSLGMGFAAQAADDSAEIRHANNGGIRDWSADTDRTFYVQDSGRQWYKGEVLGNCSGLAFASNIGFKPESTTGTFNKYSEIIVDGHNCKVTSLTKSEKPPTRKEKAAAKEAAKP